MAFFGLTSLGDGSALETVFKRIQAKNLNLHEVTDERFEEVFDKYCIANVRTIINQVEHPEKLMMNPRETMMRSDLAKVLKELLNEQEPTNDQMDAFLTFFNTDLSGFMSIEEYRASYRLIKQRSGKPTSAATYKSSTLLNQDKGRHRRIEAAPQDMYQKPVTTAHEIGWNAVAPKAYDPFCKETGKKAHNPLLSTDVTRGEGRSVTDYFL